MTERATTISGLVNAVEHTLRIVAVNTAGAGEGAEVSATPSDRIIPVLSSATVNAAALTLHFNEALDEDSTPATAAFAVEVESAARDVDAVAVSGSTLVLTLASGVAKDETVTVSYTVPSAADAATVTDSAGNAAPGLSGEPVTNETPAPGNRAPNGLPTITGPAQVHETLSASTSAITDADGLEGVTFAYQWIANDGAADTDIEDATTATYTALPNDVGKTLKVRVTFIDEGETEETLTSAATVPIAAALTASFEDTPESHDGASAFTVALRFSEDIEMSYVTMRDDALEVSGGDVTGAQRLARPTNTRWKITIKPTTQGAVTIAVPANRPCTESGAICTLDGRRLSKAASLSIPGPASANTPATGEPEVSGTAQVGETLTASTAAIEDAQGLANVSFAYQWIANDGTNDADIEDATETTYIVTPADVGNTLKVRITFTDDEENAETATSEATAPVTASVPGAPTDVEASTPSGSDGELAVSWSAPPSNGGAAITAYRVAWKSGAQEYDTTGESTRQAEVTERAYTMSGLDNGVEYTIEVRAVNTAGAGAGAEETATPRDRVAPTLSSATVNAATLTLAFNETLDEDSAPATDAFAVEVDETARTVDAVDVTGTAAVLTLASSVTEDQIVTVSYTVPTAAEAARIADGAGNAAGALASVAATNETGASNATPTGLPEVSGNAQVHQTLSASADKISDADGLENVTFEWQWIANDGAADADIENASAETYTVVEADVGKTLKVRITFTDEGDTEESLVSEATATVTAAPPEVSIVPARSPVTEGSNAVFTLKRTGDTTAALTVTVQVSTAGSVLAGSAASQATFAAQAAQASLSVATDNDATAEADGQVTASLSAGAGYTVAEGAGTARVDVLDNDRSGVTHTVIWSADMTVVDYQTGAIGAASADLFTNTESTEGLEARELWYFTPTRKLRLKLNESLDDVSGLTLDIGGLSLALAEESGGSPSFTWSDIDVEWSDGDTVAVRLTRASQAQVPSVGVSVADAQAQEAPGAMLNFRVTLDAAQSEAVSVRYATADGTATAGADYVSARGAVRFAPGQTAKTVAVAVLDDTHDDSGETLTLTLSDPFGVRIGDGRATGTITNSDPVPKAWLARFGRTVATHVVDAIGERLTDTPETGSHLTLGGQRLALDGGPDAPTPGQESGSDIDWLREADKDGTRTVTERDLLLGSSFRLTLGSVGTDDGTIAPSTRWTAWGRASESSFNANEDGLALEGDVTTFTLGADAAQGDWLAGIALAHSAGKGTFRDEPDDGDDPASAGRGAGKLESTLTTFHPYGRLTLSERISVWGILGYGTGDLTLALDQGGRWTTSTEMRMAAIGARGVLVPAPEGGGIEIAARTDALVIRMTSEAATGTGGNLDATTADVSRLRLVADGSRTFNVGERGTLTPSLELGLRYDAGDAEKGAGLEVGTSVRYTSGAMSIEGAVRGLLAHEDTDYREWGASGAIRIDPGASGRGLSLSVAPSWGNASSAAERLWSTRDAAGLVRDEDFEAESRLEAELGYGLRAPRGLGAITPHTGLTLSDGGARTWRAGARWKLSDAASLSLEGTREERGGDEAPSDALMLRAAVRW